MILPKPKPPYCLVQVREPVSRVTSCWNYRLISDGTPHGTEVQRIEDLSPEAVAMMLPIARYYYGTGCNNEMFRIISPLGMAEHIVNSIVEHPGARFALDSLMGRLPAIPQPWKTSQLYPRMPSYAKISMVCLGIDVPKSSAFKRVTDTFSLFDRARRSAFSRYASNLIYARSCYNMDGNEPQISSFLTSRKTCALCP